MELVKCLGFGVMIHKSFFAHLFFVWEGYEQITLGVQQLRECQTEKMKTRQEASAPQKNTSNTGENAVFVFVFFCFYCSGDSSYGLELFGNLRLIFFCFFC